MQTDILVIGGGPAGLTAGIYAGRAKRSVLILERAIVGGQQGLTEKIENYPGTGKEGKSGYELSRLMEEQATTFGAKVLNDGVKTADLAGNLKKIQTNFNGQIEAKAVIIATGRDPKHIGIPGEEEFRGKGVSYCAVCDGAFFREKTVAVIGGGNSALEEALYLTKFASKVIIIHRRKEFRADKIVQDKVRQHPKIELLLEYVPEKIQGKTVVESLVLKDVNSGSSKEINVQGVFIYVGNIPNTDMFKPDLALDNNGYIVTDEDMHTNLEGVFAAGDVRQKSLRQVVTAVADGAIAAIEADKYLEKEG